MAAADRSALAERVDQHVEAIWGSPNPGLADALIAAVGIGRPSDASAPVERWTESDIALITYGDSIRGNGAPLAALATLVHDRLAEAFGIVHILPFGPWSSDRGFAVIDYTAVDPALGSWTDIGRLERDVDLMFDLVANHVSTESEWFRQFLAGEEPGRSYIVTADPADDLSTVVRPRSLPLLTPFDTTEGRRHVWTTFSDDQADLDWSNPDLVCEMFRIVDLYVRNGARFLRLDAIAFLWKEAGTTSVHLPETHEFVKLLRTLLAVRAPHVAILTETNVPDAENRSYFGDGDEAHLIYNFTLPPLLVDGVLHGRADRLASWLESAPAPPAGATLFNFLASHDGIGVRPAEGFLTDAEIAELVDLTHERGGLHGTYDRAGVPFPYELNISLPDLFGGPDDPYMPARIVLAHTIVLSLAGVPAVYINSLLGTRNDHAAVEADGVRRSINRSSVDLHDVPSPTGDSWEASLLRSLLDLAQKRRRQSAFHPDAPQRVAADGALLSIHRGEPGRGITVVCNLSDAACTAIQPGPWRDLLHSRSGADTVELAPYECAWLVS